MNHQRTFATNGVGRRGRSETVHRSDVANWRSGAVGAPPRSGYSQNHVSSNSSSPPGSARPSVEDDDLGRGGAHDNPIHGRLLFLTMCLVGQLVEVQLKDGSIYSGIFHTANVDKDFGVVLKMAKLVKDAAGKPGKSDAVKQAARKPPMKSFIIYAKELVQIVAKDVFLTGEALPNGRSRENKNDLLTDSFISQNRRETERELKPWKPDTEAPRSLGLESTFQSSWNRNWDQFETNKTLFGVESTFDEELYTTKLERGPQTKEREREALRLAREIEGESIKSLHTVEDRGGSDVELDSLDEESRYSSVLRQGDVEEDDTHNKVADSNNEETFGSIAASASPSESNVSTPTAADRPVQDSVSPQRTAGSHSPRSSSSAGDLQALSINAPSAPASEEPYRDVRVLKNQGNAKKGDNDYVSDVKTFSENLKERTVKDYDGPRLQKAPSAMSKLADDLTPSDIKSASDSTMNLPAISAPPASALPIPVGLSSSASISSSSGSHSRTPSKTTSLEISPAETEPSVSSSTTAISPASSGSGSGGNPTTGTGNFKKSLLNPNAKEFKLNPNAKVFTPSFSAPRPASPINQSPIYMPAGVPVSPMQGMPVGLGFMQQPGQPAQFTQYNNTMATAANGVTAAPYIQPSATFVPGSAVPPIKLPPQTQPQVAANPYGQQQTIRYIPPMQPAPAYPHPNYPQQVIYGQPPFVYIQPYPQGMLQGQPIQLPQQTPLPPQPSSQLTQPQKHHGGEALHSNVLVGQSPLQSPLQSPVPRAQAPANGPRSGSNGSRGSSKN